MSNAKEETTTTTTEAERNLRESSTRPFFKIVLTGGPCGGKTTALARVSSYLRERGFEVFTAPEAFTILASNGFSLDYFATEGMDIVTQKTVLSWQESMEDGLESILKARGLPAVLLCDRGIQDGAAYMEQDRWERVLQTRNWHQVDVREGRYNAVFHMVTAADGAEDFYTLENNDARTETPEQAREMDCKTQKAWLGHPHHYVLDNSTDFEGNSRASLLHDLLGFPPISQDRLLNSFLPRNQISIPFLPIWTITCLMSKRFISLVIKLERISKKNISLFENVLM